MSRHFHVAKMPFDLNRTKQYWQTYIDGFNIGGRPDGLWFSEGGTWLNATQRFNNPRFPTCCYLYVLWGNPRLMVIDTQEKFAAFDADVPNYWVNFDFFDIDITDYLTGRVLRWSRRHNVNWAAIRASTHGSFRENLVREKLIFDTPEAALAGCEFYQEYAEYDIQRFRRKDWDYVVRAYNIAGIHFKNWSPDSPNNFYFWFQTLDANTGCIWNTASVRMKLVFVKTDVNSWTTSRKLWAELTSKESKIK